MSQLSEEQQEKDKAPERIWYARTKWGMVPLTNGPSAEHDNVEYIRADLVATVRAEEREAAQKVGRQAFAAELLGQLDKITSTTAAYHLVKTLCQIELGQEPDSLGVTVE